MPKKKDTSSTCPHCSKKLLNFTVLQRHLRMVHIVKDGKPSKPPPNRRCFEGDCQFGSYFSTDVIEHLKTIHGFEFDIETLAFSNEEEFETWKRNMEEETNTFYVRNSGGKMVGKKKVVKWYFRCHRSGYYRGNALSNRRLKKGTAKVNGTCTSYICLNKTSSGLIATFCKTHYRHNPNEIEHLPLTKTERSAVLEKISEGMTFEMIQEDLFRDRLEEGDLKKASRLTRQNVDTMTLRYGLSKCDKEPDNGAVLEDWVVEMTNLGPDSPVRVFKPKGLEFPDLNLTEDDFCLIIMTAVQGEFLQIFGNNSLVCVDSTMGLNVKDLNITTILIIHDYGEAFPVAFMVSNRHDVHIMGVFFETVKEVAGPIIAQTFMSPDVEAFYAAWSEVMCESPVKLLCDWQTRLDWRRNLTKIKDRTLHSDVFNLIQGLMDIVDQEEFYTVLQEVINQLFSNKKTSSYGEYFQQGYANRPELWATCFRQLEPTVNTSLEEIHKTLRSLYLDGKNIRRLDKSILNLMKLVRDRHFERERSISKVKESTKTCFYKDEHEASLSLNVEIAATSTDSWEILSQESDESTYYIEAKDAVPCCDSKCDECDICTHMYVCSCPDSVIKATICKHIHYLVSWLKMEKSKQKTPKGKDAFSTTKKPPVKVYVPDQEAVKSTNTTYLSEPTSYRFLDNEESMNIICSTSSMKEPSVNCTLRPEDPVLINAKERLMKNLTKCIALVNYATDPEQIAKSDLLVSAVNGLLSSKRMANPSVVFETNNKKSRLDACSVHEPFIIKVPPQAP